MVRPLQFIFGIILVLSVEQLWAQISLTCAPPFAQIDLDINNVRARIIAGGDLWWDLTTAGYEIPKGSGKHSIYCGAGKTARIGACSRWAFLYCDHAIVESLYAGQLAAFRDTRRFCNPGNWNLSIS